MGYFVIDKLRTPLRAGSGSNILKIKTYGNPYVFDLFFQLAESRIR
jgi:hypothetical protein